MRDDATLLGERQPVHDLGSYSLDCLGEICLVFPRVVVGRLV